MSNSDHSHDGDEEVSGGSQQSIVLEDDDDQGFFLSEGGPILVSTGIIDKNDISDSAEALKVKLFECVRNGA